jgi:DNA replication protein DnaC
MVMDWQLAHEESSYSGRLEDSPLLYRVLPQEDVDKLYAIYPSLAKSSRNGCPACGKNLGPDVDGFVEIGGAKYRCNCRDQLQRQKHYLDAGIGITYQFLWWSDWHGDEDVLGKVVDYRMHLVENVESGVGMVLRSPDFGVGKTFLAAMLAKSAVWDGISTYMTTFPDLLSSMKAGWKDSDFSKWYRHKVDSAHLLVLDDVGKEMVAGSGFNNDFAKLTMDNIVRTRVQQGRTTIVTTNLSSNDMRQVYGPALASLMSEQMVEVIVRGDDYRPQKKPSIVGHRRIC